MCPGLIFQCNDPEESGHQRSPAETKHEIGLKPVFRNETAFWWHQTLKRSCLKLHELKVPQNLLKKLSISPGNWKHNNLPSLCVSDYLLICTSLEPTLPLHGQRFLATFFVQGIDWVLCVAADYPVSTYRKKAEKSEDWFWRNLTNKAILDWLLTTGRPGKIFCKTNLQRCMICWLSGTNLITASGVLLTVALLLRRPPGGIRYRHLFFFSSDSWLGESDSIIQGYH